MKNKTVIISKHIHSGCSSFQTGDAFLNIKTNLKELGFEPVLNERFYSNKFPFLNGQLIEELDSDNKCVIVYLESDKTFYYKGLRESSPFKNGFSESPEFKDLVQKYIDNGFEKKNFPEYDAFREREKIRNQKKAKKQGIVLCMDYEILKQNTSLYQGGFSDEVFNSPELQEYVKGVPFGWIGNSDRTIHADKLIEKGLRERGISPSRMFNWISSSSGRHFGDSLGGYTKKEQAEKIKQGLNYMYDCCIVYSFKCHKGMLSDTININQRLKEFNILLDSNKKYDSKKHLNNLLKTQKILSKKTELDEFESELLELVNEIFTNKV